MFERATFTVEIDGDKKRDVRYMARAIYIPGWGTEQNCGHWVIRVPN